MNWRKVTIYFFAPLALVLPMVFMYFSGVELLQNIISPEFEGLYGNSNRELGLLESAQNIVLLVIIVLLVRGLLLHKTWWLRAGIFVALCGAVFIFLEETDYGLHYKEFFTGVTADEAAERRNWHNVGDRTNRMKQLVDAGTVLWFVIAPFALARSAHWFARVFVPDKYAALTLVAAFITRSLAHGLQDAGFEGSGTMSSNLSEFRELVTYYLGAAYLFDVSERRLLGRPRLGDPLESHAVNDSPAPTETEEDQ